MVPKRGLLLLSSCGSFRVMLFRMVPKQKDHGVPISVGFRVMLFRMVPKLKLDMWAPADGFRVMLFRLQPVNIVMSIVELHGVISSDKKKITLDCEVTFFDFNQQSIREKK
ncbi:hypothetical protein IGK25_002607 [Enterococcus sp. DIV1614a]